MEEHCLSPTAITGLGCSAVEVIATINDSIFVGSVSITVIAQLITIVYNGSVGLELQKPIGYNYVGSNR